MCRYFLCKNTVFHSYFEFDKIANSIYVSEFNLHCVKFVWRQSEFAFCVRQLRLAHFFNLGEIYYVDLHRDRHCNISIGSYVDTTIMRLR